MKKMVCLEGEGYILSPRDIVWAAENQFSSYEDANEVFHHLVDEKGLNVNAVEEMHKNAPLHSACLNGSIFGVKWLVEHNADIHCFNWNGKTPLMLACGSSINRSLKVHYLDEKEVHYLTMDPEGKTALFYAIDDLGCKDDAKDVLQFLVIERGIDINSNDDVGVTPLLRACASNRSSLAIIEQIIILGADVSAKTRSKQNALHMVAKKHNAEKSVIDLLISKGVDILCEDEGGKTPYQLSYNGEIRALLRKHYDTARFSVLLREKVRPNLIKMCVFGSEMAGKTTLVNSLLQLNRPPIDPKDRTPGIEVHNREIPGVGRGTTWDFGAQSTFYRAHGLFFGQSNTMFVLVLPIRKGENMTEATVFRLVEEGRFWCAFTKTSLQTLLPPLRLRLVVIFNCIGFNEGTGREVRFQLKRVAEILQKDFEDTFQILHVIELDCSKSLSACMNNFRKKLKNIREEMLEAADDVPKLCRAIEEYVFLPDKKKKRPLVYFLDPEQFEKWVAEDIGISLTEEEKEVAVDYLDSSGIIINLVRRICVRPLWLCHNVIGPLLAPPYFLFGMPCEKSGGKASKEDIASALRAFENHLKEKGRPSPFVVTAEEAIEVLLHLELCFELQDTPGVYQIPALLEAIIPLNAWKKDSTLDVYRGQRYECLHSVDIISPTSFAILQCRCYHMANVTHNAWKNGIKIVKIIEDKEVECLITIGVKMGHHCIDVILRWSRKDKCEAVAKEFLDELKLMIVQVCQERSPGVILNWFYLDSSRLQKLEDDPAIYLSSEVEQKAVDHKLFSTRPEGCRCRIRDLVIIVPRSSFTLDSFPADDASVSEEVMRACAAIDGAEWENMSVALGISQDARLEIRQTTSSTMLRRLAVLETWKRREKSATVGQLVRCLLRANISRNAIEESYKVL